VKIFSGSSNILLAGKIAKKLKIELSRLEIHIFPDEEKRIRVIDKVLGEDVVLVQSTSINADKNYMELFFTIDALKRSGAKKVTAVVSYIGYAKQDHIFRTGEAVSMEVIINILEALGVDKLIVFDLHSSRIPELFKIPVLHLSALPIFAKTIKEKHWDGDETVIVSPDRGGIRRVKILCGLLNNMPYIAIEKNRDLKSGKISMEEIKEVTKKRAIIVDDMISTGATIVKAAYLLSKKGAKEIFVFATHPVFSGNAPKLLQESRVEKVFVTDTIDVSKNKLFPKLEVLSVAEIIAKSIQNSKVKIQNYK
jgi:ribose-phosphate pyrophosphokinase